ncbi:MAG: ATP-binding protein [Candidatus Omnitrophota bacterium]
MTPIQEIYKALEFVSNATALTKVQSETIAPILETEINMREERHIRHLLHRSGLKPIKKIEDFSWDFNMKIDRDGITRMIETSWHNDVRNFTLIGPSGVGKTHLAKSACYKAILNGIPATFITCHDLIMKLKESRNRSAALNYYAMVKLLCIDEIEYIFPEAKDANELFQIISKRSELTSTIITTNIIPSQWGKIFEAATATAILDRLSYNGIFITCEGKSYRSKK